MERADYNTRLDIIRKQMRMYNAERGKNISQDDGNLLVEKYARDCDRLNIPTSQLDRVLEDASRSREGLCTRGIEAACLTLKEETKITSDMADIEYFESELLRVQLHLIVQLGAFCNKMNIYDKFLQASEYSTEKDADGKNVTVWKSVEKRKKLLAWCKAKGFAFDADTLARYKLLTDRIQHNDFSRGEDMTYEQYVRKTGDDSISKMAKTCHALLSMVKRLINYFQNGKNSSSNK